MTKSNSTHKPVRNAGGTTFYSVKQAARAIGVHHNTIRKWIRSGQIRSARLGPSPRSPIYIPKEEIDRMLEVGE